MKPAWKETWQPGRPDTQAIVTSGGEWVARFSPAPGVSPDHELARAKLASAAPEMARFLLWFTESESSGRADEAEEILTKAGVLPR